MKFSVHPQIAFLPANYDKNPRVSLVLLKKYKSCGQTQSRRNYFFCGLVISRAYAIMGLIMEVWEEDPYAPFKTEAQTRKSLLLSLKAAHVIRSYWSHAS